MVVGLGLEQRYGSAAGAEAYRRKYERSAMRRWSARREAGLLRWALARAGTAGAVLDAPCGAGRMTPVILERATRVTAVDRSAAMVEEARNALAGPVAAGRVVLAEGDVESLSFEAGTFDTAVCWRLLHHVVDRDARVRVLAGLSRVSRRAVVVTFADAASWKARLERRRGRDRRCVTRTAAELSAEAADAGLALDATRRLSSLFSLLAVAVLRPRAAEARPPGIQTRA